MGMEPDGRAQALIEYESSFAHPPRGPVVMFDSLARRSVDPVSPQALTPVERLNFLITNRIPRRWATLFMGRFSRIKNPLIRDLSLFVWQLFVDDLRLNEAEKQRFESLHDCFTRRLKPGARPVDSDPGVVVSPCDGILGASGSIQGDQVIQAKGFPYRLTELMGDEEAADRYRDGCFATLRLKSSMYHRFHAPYDARVAAVNYISGDTWNVNPIALKTIEKLFCKNERVLMELRIPETQESLALVAVAAILVASVQLSFLDYPLDLKFAGPNRIECDAFFRKGEELGYFQHGSTVLVFTPPGYRFCADPTVGTRLRMGEPLFRRP